MSKKQVKQLTKAIGKLNITPYHKRRCNCPFCGRSVVAHKLRRHQKRAECVVAQLLRKMHGL